MNFPVIFAILGFVAVSQGSPFQDCGSKTGKYTKITVTGCSDSDNVCVLKRGTEASIAIDFTSDVDSASLKTAVQGVLGPVTVDFPIPNADACVDSGVDCPIKQGSSYNYQNTLPIENGYPKLAVDVNWRLQDANGDDVVCVKIKAKIQ